MTAAVTLAADAQIAAAHIAAGARGSNAVALADLGMTVAIMEAIPGRRAVHSSFPKC